MGTATLERASHVLTAEEAARSQLGPHPPTAQECLDDKTPTPAPALTLILTLTLTPPTAQECVDDKTPTPAPALTLTLTLTPPTAQECVDDIRGECEQFGPVVMLVIPTKDDLQGFSMVDAGKCFVRYEQVTSAIKAYDALNGRSFDGNTVRATFLPTE